MTFFNRRNMPAVLMILLFAISASAQNRFDGYSFTLAAVDDSSCPLRYLPVAGGANSIDVYLAGTGQKSAATGITPCDGSRVMGGRVAPNASGRWCFQGREELYEIKLSNGDAYLWYPVTKDTGFYNVKDFRPVTRGSDAKYEFAEPPDYSRTIRNAVYYIASRQGGTLRFPDGDYTVGTTDGRTRDPSFTGITLPSGITIEGASGNTSITNTDLPTRLTAARIRLRHEDQTIFKIGGCTNHVAIRQLELLGNSPDHGESSKNSTGDYGIEAVGLYPIRPTGVSADNASQFFSFEQLTFQNFDKGIYVHNAGGKSCNERVQNCWQWRFDYVRVEHSYFVNNKTGIWIETYNTDWKISNSVFNYIAENAPGDGINIALGGSVVIDQCWGGGYDYGRAIGGTFVSIGTVGSLTIIGSASERGKRSIYMNPVGAMSSLMINVIGSIFHDKIELNGRVNYISSGNFYGAKTMQADPSVMITSTGDRYCYDPIVVPGRCTDENGNTVVKPGFDRGRVMFRTGRPGEGTGANRLEGQPNFFGYDVEIGDGLMQFDPNITFKDITAWAAGGGTRPAVRDGALVYCKDCKKNSNGICSQGAAGTDGAFAKRISGQWRCD